MAFCACQSAPFVREDGVRRNATHEDFRNLVRLTQVIDELDTPGYPICEPADLDVETRHLDLQLTLATETDKPFAAAQFDPIGCTDSIAMAAIVHGGLEAITEQPALFGVINANSPLRFDGRMLDSLLVLARARQAVVVTPFILMGAMGPVSVAASLAQQTAESLTGIALAQLVRRAARRSWARSSRTRTCSPARPASAAPSRRSACSPPVRSRGATACSGARAAAV